MSSEDLTSGEHLTSGEKSEGSDSFDSFSASDSDPLYDAELEEDRGEPEDVEYDKLLERVEEFERMADEAASIPEHELASISTTPPTNALDQGPVPESQAPESQHTSSLAASTSNVSTKTYKKRKGRGQSKGVKAEEDMVLEYDDLGQPCGKWRGKYGRHIGTCTRKLSILQEWVDVDEGLKTSMWEDTVNLFHIDADENKKGVFLSGVAERFRDFKSKLVSGWITKSRKRTKTNDERLPPDIYSHINKDTWEAFVAQKTTPQQVENRAKHSKCASMKKAYHHMGQNPYSQHIEKLVAEGFYQKLKAYTQSEAHSEAGTSSSTTSPTRSRPLDWVCSLYSKDANGERVIKDPEVKKLVDAVLGIKKQESTGESQVTPNKDALNVVCGPDHNGRLKGYGGVRVGKRKVFKKDGATSRNSTPKLLDSDMEKRVEELVNERFKILLVKLGLPDVSSLFEQHLQDKSSKHATEKSSEPPEEHLVPDVEEQTPCTLFLPAPKQESQGLVDVAFGNVQPKVDGQVSEFGGVDDHHCVVSIDSVVDGWEDSPLPVPRPDFTLNIISDAQGSFVAWPRKWVRFSKEVEDEEQSLGVEDINNNIPCKSKEVNQAKEIVQKKISSKGSNLGGDTFLDDVDVIRSLSFECRWLHDVVKDEAENRCLKVVLSKSQFHYFEDTETWITKGEINDFLMGQQVSVALMQAFMSFLYLDLDGRESMLKFGWICPQEIYDQRCLKNKAEVKDYIETSIKEAVQSKRKILFAPYLQDTHWVLLVLSPSTYTVYVLDSCRTNPPRSLIIMTWVNSVMKKVRTSTKIPNLISVKCAQQQNEVECGYYVMRYMCDIIASCAEYDDLQTRLSTSSTVREGTFTVSEIDEVRDKVANFLTTYCT